MDPLAPPEWLAIELPRRRNGERRFRLKPTGQGRVAIHESRAERRMGEELARVEKATERVACQEPLA